MKDLKSDKNRTKSSMEASGSKQYEKVSSEKRRVGTNTGKKNTEDDGNKEMTLQKECDQLKVQQKPALFKECHIDGVDKPKTGLQSLFRWFTRKNKIPSHGGSAMNLSSSKGNSSLKIHHSISADTPSKMKKAHKIAIAQAHMEQSPKLPHSRMGKRNSDVSLLSNGSVTSHQRAKKRQAPPPPVASFRGLDTLSLSNTSIDSHSTCDSFVLHRRIKGPAPLPPEKMKTGSPHISRPPSKFSIGTVSSEMTIQSSSGYISELEGSVSTSPFPSLKSSVGSLSPKPWYKRKKGLRQKKEIETFNKERVYDSWMPEVQYSRKTLDERTTNISPTFQSVITNSRCSALCNISDLDQAAAEIVKGKKLSKLIAKEDNDRKSYQTKPRLLKQEDFKTEEQTPHVREENLAYDNVNLITVDSVPKVNKVQQDAAINKPEDKSIQNQEEFDDASTPKLAHPIYTLKSKPTPLEQAAHDPELFYQLSKDTKGKGLAKVSVPPVFTKEEDATSKCKNFGVRINNIFSPDVSTILEGSESTSSLTYTDEIERDFQALAAVSVIDPDLMSTTSDFRIDALDLDDIVDNFAKETSDSHAPTENQDLSSLLKTRQKENFSVWQELKQRADESSYDIQVTSAERNMKWICSTCTLINNPWRLHCEACSSMRMPRPKRVDEKGRIISYGVNNVHIDTISKRADTSLDKSDQTQSEEPLQIEWESELNKFLKENNLSSTPYPTNEEVRQARIKKFDVHRLNTEYDIAKIKDKFESYQVDESKSILKSVSKAEFHTKVQEFESFLMKSRENNMCNNKGRKKPTVKANGNVKNAVSLFNQKEVKPVDKKFRRPSLASCQSQASDEVLPDNVSECSGSSASNRAKNIKLDIDIMTAINKFDEMAAKAEVDHLSKRNKTLSCKKINNSNSKCDNFSQSVLDHSQSGSSIGTATSSSVPTSPNDASVGVINGVNRFKKTQKTRLSSFSTGSSEVQSVIAGSDSMRKEQNVLETQHNASRNSISVRSSTFELIQPQEFACISAQHSERPSPTREFGRTSEFIKSYNDVLVSSQKGLDMNNSKNHDLSAKEVPGQTINEHLKKLELAISAGKHEEAAILARELASMQLACSAMKSKEEVNNSEATKSLDEKLSPPALRIEKQPLTSSQSSRTKEMSIPLERRAVKSAAIGSSESQEQRNKSFNVEMFIEDRTTHQGPIGIEVTTELTVFELREKIEKEFGFPKEVQRWILGRKLADDNNASLGFYKVNTEKCPIFLYLVAPEIDINKPQISKNNIKFVLEEPTTESANAQLFSQEDGNAKGARRRCYSKKSEKVKLRKKPSDKAFGNIPHLRPPSASSSSPDAGSSTSTGSTLDRNLSSSSSSKNFNSIPENPICQTPAPSNKQEKFWSCTTCTLLNALDRPGCEACATSRPDQEIVDPIELLETKGCIPNGTPFECAICFLTFGKMEGVVLRECLHTFCRPCLRNAVIFSEHAAVKCPFLDQEYSCEFCLQDREIKDLITEDEYMMHDEKSVRQAAGNMSNVFYCKTVDCKAFCQFEDNVNVFKCHLCSKVNCLTCQSQHEGMTCKEYQDDITDKKDEEAMETKKFFDDIIRRGNGMFCPNCSVMLVRKWGCDWMRCPMCRAEICWVTRGPRWGPAGPGDTSGGCKCGVNGRKCHPKCTYCH